MALPNGENDLDDEQEGELAAGSGMNDDQFGNLIAAILTAGTLAASRRGILEAKMIPVQFFQVRSELRAAGIIHRKRTLSSRRAADQPLTGRRSRDLCGDAG